MKKKTIKVFGKTYYLLGKGKDGINYYLAKESWDCGWYYGYGYVESFTNNRSPEQSKDISSHQHFDGLFLKGPECARAMFKDFFEETVLDDFEIWELVDYMKTFYTLKATAELFKYGYSWQTEMAQINELRSDEHNDLVNKVWLPEVFKRVTKLLTEEK